MTTWDALVERVRERGRYATDDEAVHRIHIVLAALGARLAGADGKELARELPEPGATLLREARPAGETLSAQGLVDAVAARIDGSSIDTARWDTSAVLGVVADLADDALMRRVIAQLPSGYALLFGRAELA